MPAGSFRQLAIDETYGFKKLAPIQRREQAHARNDVADRDLRPGLPAVFFLNDVVDRQVALVQLHLKPLNRRQNRRILLAQALRQLHDERAAECLSPPESPRNQRHDVRRIQLRRFEERVGQLVGVFALGARGNDACCQPAKIFYERESQSDRHRPHFTNRKRRDVLISVDEAAQCFGIEIAVRMRDQRQRQMRRCADNP